MPLLALPPALPNPLRGVFVTGTDTGVGKTFISALLAQAWNATYWKPLQTGLTEETGDTETVTSLASLPPERIIPPAYTLKAPLSPHMAAQRENITFDLTRLNLPQSTHPLIVEGAGGLMVPICDNMLMIDLIKHLNLPVILVIRCGLGTLNHTLLSLEALYQRSIPVLGFVMNGGHNPENCHLLEKMGQTSCLFSIPHLSPPISITMIDYICSIPLWDDFRV